MPTSIKLSLWQEFLFSSFLVTLAATSKVGAGRAELTLWNSDFRGCVSCMKQAEIDKKRVLLPLGRATGMPPPSRENTQWNTRKRRDEDYLGWEEADAQGRGNRLARYSGQAEGRLTLENKLEESEASAGRIVPYVALNGTRSVSFPGWRPVAVWRGYRMAGRRKWCVQAPNSASAWRMSGVSGLRGKHPNL